MSAAEVKLDPRENNSPSGGTSHPSPPLRSVIPLALFPGFFFHSFINYWLQSFSSNIDHSFFERWLM